MNGGRAFYTPSSPHMTISHVTYAAPAPATSSATLNSILTTTASPRAAAQQFQHTLHHQQQRRHQEPSLTVPAKRKIQEMSQSPQGTSYHLDEPLHTPPSGKGSHIGHNGLHTPPTAGAADVSSEAVDCICGFAIDDGFSIACDICSRWCHSACFGIDSSGVVPDSFVCWVCNPRPHHVKETAIALQRSRLDAGLLGTSGLGLGLVLGRLADDGAKQRRRVSPGTDRKARRGSTTTVESGGPAKKRRRPSVVHPVAIPTALSIPSLLTPPTSTLSTNPVTTHPMAASTPITNGVAEEEHVDIDTEPWTATYVPITKDIIPDDETRSKLRRQARAWRGITAVSSSPPPFVSTEPVALPKQPLTPSIAIRALPPTPSPLLPSTNPHCLPPSYATYTTRPLPSSSMLVPFHSLITPTSSYLREPTNGYAGLGMPKPHVHLLGPPLGVALDARGVGSEGRFVRWGCRPNAVLRPVICREAKASKKGIRREEPIDIIDEDATEDEDTHAEQQRRNRRKAEKARADETEDEDDDTTLGFAVFALRDLKEGEEVVLGWEWDDGHAIHRLPALLKTPGMFPHLPAHHAKHSPAELLHLRNQLSNILHAIASTFTTCACGSTANDCALIAMANAVERLESAGADFSNWTPQDTNERRSSYGWDQYGTDDEGRQERGLPPYRAQQPAWPDADLGPLIGRKRGFKTRERVPLSGGLGGMEEVNEEADAKKRENGQKRGRTNGKAFVVSAMPETPKTSPVFTLSVVSPDGENRGKGKGKGRAVDDDVEMRDGDGPEPQRSAPVDADRPLDHDHLHPNSIPNLSIPSSRAQPNLEPRPPDPPDEDKMPPKMRKRWMHREVEARNSRREVPPQTDSLFSTTPGPDALSIGAAFRNGGVGLGIRFDIPEAEHYELPSARTPPPPSAQDQPTDQPDQAERTQPALPETSLMPPPPIPISRDITPAASQYLSPTTPTPSPPSPHLTTPSPPTHAFTNGRHSPRIMNTEHGDDNVTPSQSDLYQERKGTMATSPLHDFVNLSLMSPAAIAEVRAQVKSKVPFSKFLEADDAAGEPEPQPPRDEDVEMETGENEEHKGDGRAFAEQLPADGERMEVQGAMEWSPLRRVEKMPVNEVEVHAASEHEPRSSLLELEAARKSVMLTVSPLDSLASTPTARLSPPPVVVLDVLPGCEEVEQEDGAQERPIAEMEVDEQPSDIPAQSTPRVVVPEITAPSPASFFDTDDPDEWKRQMESSAPPAIPAREPEIVLTAPDEEEAIKTPTGSPVPSDRAQSSRSVSPFEEITVMVEAQDETEPDEILLQSGTTADSEPPRPSAESSAAVEPLTTAIDAAQLTVESQEAPLPASAASTEHPASNDVVSPVDQSNATARQDSQDPTSPATQPKVKLTLKDFALRRRKQREELGVTTSTHASPMSVTSALAAEEGDGDRGGATPKSSIASPCITNLTPRWLREPAIISGPVVEMPKAPEALPALKGKELGELKALTSSRATENLADIAKLNVDVKVLQDSENLSAVKPEQLPAKSFANESSKLLASAPLALSTPTVPASESLHSDRPNLNGVHQPIRMPFQPPAPPSLVSTEVSIISTSTPPPMLVSKATPTAAIITWEAKKEFIDVPLSNLSATRPPTLKLDNPPIPSPSPYLAPPVRSMYPDRSISPMGPVPARSSHYRRPSHEDGEIGEGPPPIAPPRYSGANSTYMPKTRLFASGLPAGLPPAPLSSHSPPTGPRSLYAPSTSPTPTFGSGSGSHYRPVLPPHSIPPSSTTAPNRPLPPSAPRALRQSMMSGRSGGGGGGGGNASTSSYSHGGSQYVPRGPLADQRDRDRDWDHHRPYRRRGGGGRAR